MKTAAIFQSGMVLQREKPIKIWGAASAGERIIVEIQNQRAETRAGENGDWSVTLQPLSASEEECLYIYSDTKELVYEDVAVGEVWIAGGQSNMEFFMRYEKHLAEERENSENRRIRFFDVPEIAYDGQEQDFDYSRMGIWRKAGKKDIEYFSAAAYYFEKSLEKELQVPVGVIGCNWGGTTSSVWMSEKSVKCVGTPWYTAFKNRVQDLDLDAYREAQHRNPMNHTGDPFANAFTELMLPRTPSAEEIREFFESQKGEPVDLSALKPQEFPGSLYKHMVKAVAPFGIRGVLWYQGESDDGLGCQELYGEMLKALMSDWRNLWKDAKLPFLIVQLPGWESWFGGENKNWAMIRSCQEKVTLEDKYAFLCSISDSGEQYDIHPKNKRVVGYRLALLALSHIYGMDVMCDAPMALEIKPDGRYYKIIFGNTYGALWVKGEKINALHVFRNGRKIPFHAEINGTELWISPEGEGNGNGEICFATDKWYQVNLFNKAGIPAIPFRFEF